MTRDEIKLKVIDCLATTGCDTDHLPEGEPLPDLGVDSLMKALWVVELERRFSIRMPIEKLKALGTLGDVIVTIESLVGQLK
jgi:acyl carrier protein